MKAYLPGVASKFFDNPYLMVGLTLLDRLVFVSF